MARRHQEEDLKAEESDLKKLDLFTDSWWENPEGMHLTVVPEVDVDNTLVTKLEIKKAIFDVNDWHKSRYKARIATDGTGLIVTEPVQVGWMWQQPTMIQDLINGGPHKTCERTLKKYKTYCLDYKKSKEKQTKEVFYRFADGFTVNNNFFNPKVGRHTLDVQTEFKIVQVAFTEGKQKLTQFCPMVYWKVAIDGDDKTHEDETGIGNIASAFGHVSIQGTSHSTNEMNDDDDIADEVN